MRISLTILTVLALVGASVAYVRYHKADSIDVTLPVQGPAVQAVYATGTVEPSVMIPVAGRLTARLTELNVDEGVEVEKGQELAHLEDEELLQATNELRAREQFARQEFERHSSLLNSNAISRQAYEKAKAAHEEAKAALRSSEAKLRYMLLVAPEKGRVIRRDGEIGELIPANQPLFWLSCCAPLRVSAEVDEEDIPLVSPGLKALIRADAFPGQVFEGTVKSITPKGDPIARSYRVRVSLPETTPLFIGMTAEVNIVVRETPNAILIPTSAVVNSTVWVIQNGKTQPKPVVVGATGTEQTEIVTGINLEDQVIIKPDPSISAGISYSPRLSPQKSR